MYQPLLEHVQNARRRSAKFYRVDLHIHSHESHDFPCLGDKPGCATALTSDDKAATCQHFIVAAQNAEIDLIAITDHNKSKAAADIAGMATGVPVALPGMEVSLKTTFLPDSTVHVLTIFPEKHGHGDIERVFSATTMPLYAERTTDSVLDMPVQDFIKAVHSTGGICIASHVNGTKGVRDLFRASNTKLLKVELRRRELLARKRKSLLTESETNELSQLEASLTALEGDTQNRYLQFLAEYGFDAVEVQHGDEKQFYTGTHVDDLGTS